jgi:hypothetical protein
MRAWPSGLCGHWSCGSSALLSRDSERDAALDAERDPDEWHRERHLGADPVALST